MPADQDPPGSLPRGPGRDAAAGGRWVEVPPGRIVRWVETFEARHGPVAAEAAPDVVTLRARDGAVARCHPPFPPMALPPAAAAGALAPAALAHLMAEHAAAGRAVGVLLVRLGGYAAGVFAGSPPQLVASKVGSRPVHSRAAAGGWSQHRFARRRDNQAAAARRAAADAAASVLAPRAGRLDAVVLGGDRRAVAAMRDDPRLAQVMALAVERFLTVPDPRLVVLKQAPALFQAVRVQIAGPGP